MVCACLPQADQAVAAFDYACRRACLWSRQQVYAVPDSCTRPELRDLFYPHQLLHRTFAPTVACVYPRVRCDTENLQNFYIAQSLQLSPAYTRVRRDTENLQNFYACVQYMYTRATLKTCKFCKLRNTACTTGILIVELSCQRVPDGLVCPDFFFIILIDSLLGTRTAVRYRIFRRRNLPAVRIRVPVLLECIVRCPVYRYVVRYSTFG